MIDVTTAEAREHLSDIVNRVAFGGERVIITRRGKKLAAIVPIADVEWMEELEDRLDIEEADAALADVREHGTISWEEIKADHGL